VVEICTDYYGWPNKFDKNEVRRAYNRAEYLERRKVIMCWWSQHIENAATGKVSSMDNIKHLKVV
jgi:hypothetical protein